MNGLFTPILTFLSWLLQQELQFLNFLTEWAQSGPMITVVLSYFAGAKSNVVDLESNSELLTEVRNLNPAQWGRGGKPKRSSLLQALDRVGVVLWDPHRSGIWGNRNLEVSYLGALMSP